jgi:threonyl-tRNA synthetase
MNIEKKIRVLLYPVSSYDRRSDAELIENNAYTLEDLETLIPNDVSVYSLTDFMDLCNNQELNLEEYWVSYIRIID